MRKMEEHLKKSMSEHDKAKSAKEKELKKFKSGQEKANSAAKEEIKRKKEKALQIAAQDKKQNERER